MVELRRAALGAFALTLVTSLSPRASAQLHWDGSLEAGASKRFLAKRPQGADDAGFGPAVQLAGHVAIIPLVRAGLYAGYEISPLPGDAAARDMIPFGARAKLMSPFPRGDARAWVFAGFGYTLVGARGYDTKLAFPTGVGGSTTTQKVSVQDAGGGFFDVPFGIGASYKLFESWHLVGELGMHVGFGHSGSVYEPPGPQVKVEGAPDNNVVPSGVDRFGIGLLVGVMLDP
jgi:hypothetical protein